MSMPCVTFVEPFVLLPGTATLININFEPSRHALFLIGMSCSVIENGEIELEKLYAVLILRLLWIELRFGGRLGGV
jgi:hypothetical protein